MKKFAVFFAVAAAAVFIAVTSYAAYMFFAVGDAACTDEDGCLEILQACILVMNFAMFAAAAALAGRGKGRAILLFCAMVCYAGILREVDFDKMNLGAFADFMLYGAGRYATLIVGFAAILGYAALNFKRYFGASLRFIKSASGILFVFAGVFILTGGYFEHSGLGSAQFLEEFFELVGYYCIMASALAALVPLFNAAPRGQPELS